MNHFTIAVTEEKAEVTREALMLLYPRLPVDIIDGAIETCSWHTLFSGTNRYNTQAALEHYETMASDLLEERNKKSNDVIEVLMLEHDERSEMRAREHDTELVKGIRSIPDGVLRMILKSVQTLWTQVPVP